MRDKDDMTETYQDQFSRELMKELLSNRTNNYKDNQPSNVDDYNTIKYAEDAYDRSIITILLNDTFKLFSLSRLKKILIFNIYPQYYYKKIIEKYTEIGLLYKILNDKESKKILLKLCAFRIFGHKRIKLSRHNKLYWERLQEVKQYVENDSDLKINLCKDMLKIFNMKILNIDMKVYSTELGFCCVFLQKQYEYHAADVICKVEEGDYVIDAGACWGETTICFAHGAGYAGMVFAFEFIPSNLNVIRENIALNQHLKNRIKLIEHPIWSESEQKLYYVDWGPGSRVTSDENKYNYQGTCNTLSIDDFVERNQIEKIDFIKMDIEGAEFNALQGAENTIRKFRPKLAISLYHSLDDFITIPNYLNSLNLDYQFHLDHHTIYQNETVLFAIPNVIG